METGEIIIIDERENSTMASTWNEFLCLTKLKNGRWRLDIQGYEPVGSVDELADEEGKLPDEIDGWKVIGVEDEWVVVDKLVQHSDSYASVEFHSSDLSEVKEMFEGEWYSELIEKKIREAIA